MLPHNCAAASRARRRVGVCVQHVQPWGGLAVVSKEGSGTLHVVSASAKRNVVSVGGGDVEEDVNLDAVAYGFMASQALFSALELGVFDKAAEYGASGATLLQLQEACGINAPRLQTLLTALVATKCLRLSDGQRYTLSPNAAQFMVSTSPHYYGDYLRYQIGRQFYKTMATLPDIMRTGEGPTYSAWFSDPEVAKMYTQAQHNGSTATAKRLVSKLQSDLAGAQDMLDVGGGSGAFSFVFASARPGLRATVLELPEVCRTGERIRAEQPEEVARRVAFRELDVTEPKWPVPDQAFDVVLMSYISGSVPTATLEQLYQNAFAALRPKGRLLIHDFMVDDDGRGPVLGALWALTHVSINPEGLGLRPSEITSRLVKVGFDGSMCRVQEMIRGMTKLIVASKG